MKKPATPNNLRDPNFASTVGMLFDLMLGRRGNRAAKASESFEHVSAAPTQAQFNALVDAHLDLCSKFNALIDRFDE